VDGRRKRWVGVGEGSVEVEYREWGMEWGLEKGPVEGAGGRRGGRRGRGVGRVSDGEGAKKGSGSNDGGQMRQVGGEGRWGGENGRR